MVQSYLQRNKVTKDGLDFQAVFKLGFKVDSKGYRIDEETK